MAAVTRGVVGEGVVTGFREERTREWGDRRVVVGGGLAAVTGGIWRGGFVGWGGDCILKKKGCGRG